MDSGNYVSKLNEHSQKTGLKPPVYEDLGFTGPDNMRIYTQRVHFNGEVLADGVGNKKQIAKHDAAKKAYGILMDRRQEPAAASTSAQPAVLNVNNQDSTNRIDYVSVVNIYCQKTKQFNNYIEVTPEAQSQKPFACRMEIGPQRYPVGTGLNKRDAKQIAARLAWSALKQQPDWDSKVSVGSATSRDDESETTATSESDLLEPEFSAQSAQPSSGSSSIQFKDSKSSPAQESSSTQGTGKGKNTENAVKPSRFTSEYDHIEPLGNGFYGQVYKARRIILGSYKAIKEIPTKDLQKSLQEVNVLSELLHPNIVRYYTCWDEEKGYSRPNSNVLFIEMEFCDGGTLRAWIKSKNRVPLDNSRQTESLKFAGEILSGVEYIHSKKLIHRDLKPTNIFLGQDGKVRIGDFGLATQDNDEGEVVERTEGRGTRSYMAPEQFGVNYDRKVDVFALGLIFFELFWKISTGHEREVIWNDVRCQKLPKEFTQTYPLESHFIKEMLSNKPEDRPEACAVKSELGKWTRTPEEGIDQKTV